MEKVVTCIITAYKKFEYIYGAIESALSQNYPAIELIVCDDCSGNFPENDIVSFIEKNKRDNLIGYKVYSNPENYGTVKNVNIAIKQATGDYFIDVSADDAFFDSNVFSKVVKAFEETGALCATCRAIMTGGAKRIEGLSFQTEAQVRMLQTMTPQQFFDRISKDNISIGAAHYFTKETLEKFGLFDEKYKYIEDLPRFLSISSSGNKVWFFDIPTVWHRMDGISNSKDVSLRYLEDNLSICRNEILARKEFLSRSSYRYNLCREASICYRLKNAGRIKLSKKLILFFKYPDSILYNTYSKFSLLYGKRKKYYR